MTLALISVIFFLASPILIGPALALLRIRGERAVEAEPEGRDAPADRRVLPPAA